MFRLAILLIFSSSVFFKLKFSYFSIDIYLISGTSKFYGYVTCLGIKPVILTIKDWRFTIAFKLQQLRVFIFSSHLK